MKLLVSENKVIFIDPFASRGKAFDDHSVWNVALTGNAPSKIDIAEMFDHVEVTVDDVDCIETIIEKVGDRQINLKIEKTNMMLEYCNSFSVEDDDCICAGWIMFPSIKQVEEYVKNSKYPVYTKPKCPISFHGNTKTISVVASKSLESKNDLKILKTDKSMIPKLLESGYSVYEYFENDTPRRLYLDVDDDISAYKALELFDRMIKDLQQFLHLDINIRYELTMNRNSIHGGTSYHIITNLAVPSYRHARYLVRNFMRQNFDNPIALTTIETSYGSAEQCKGTYSFLDPLVYNRHQLFRVPYSYNGLSKIKWWNADRYDKYIKRDPSEYDNEDDRKWNEYYKDLQSHNMLAYSRADDFHFIVKKDIFTSCVIQDINRCIMITDLYPAIDLSVDKILDETPIMERKFISIPKSSYSK